MKKWSLLWILFLLACSDEYPVGPEPSVPTLGEQEVSIKITFPGSERVDTKSPATYAITAEDENTVNSLDIFAFASGGANVPPSDDKFLYRVQVAGSEIQNASGSTAGATKEVTTFLRRLPQKQRFIFIANLPSSISLDNLTEGVTTQQEIVDRLKFDGSPWRSAQALGNYTPIPMWGQKKDSILINSDSSLDLGKVYLIRSMAKVDVSVAAGIPGFDVKSIYLCNSSDSGYIAPAKDQWGEQVITKTNTTVNRTGTPVEYQFLPEPGRNIMEYTIYVPETDSLIVTGTDSVKPAYLVIKAEYNQTLNYYRVDFAKDRVYHPLLRNHRYLINIIGAKEGYQSLEEALKAPMSDFNFSLVLDGSENVNEVVYLGDQYMLGIEVSEVLADWDKPWIGKPLNEATNPYLLSVYTTYSGGWKASLSGAPSWVTLDDATAGAKDTPGKVTIKMLEENRTGAEREATLTIRAGMLIKEVKIRQSGGANSRMICFGAGMNTATTRIPLAFAEVARGGGGNFFSSIGDASFFDAKVIWQEAGSGQAVFTAAIGGAGALKDRHIEVTAKAGALKSGNAVVAIVRKGSGVSIVGGIDDDEVLWSWHIWSMGDDDYMDKDYHNPNVSLFMKRALGWYNDNNGNNGNNDNNGMFYQWGRKDPFPKNLTDVEPMNVANRPVEVANNLSNTIKSPATFYYKVALRQWMGDLSYAQNLWRPAPANKTYNDPCPAGWRVPNTSDKAYWPAGSANDFLNGYLSEGSGILTGSSESLWTSVSGSIFTLSGSGVPAEGSSELSAGRSVRCIKDIQLIKTSL
ncbi:MAG: hypothetical protein LBF62_05845 [Tannerellaceae bacterium]|jgi:hypothetical protein|nr:hypothetical protein [Tannerellaceae bacterium]